MEVRYVACRKRLFISVCRCQVRIVFEQDVVGERCLRVRSPDLRFSGSVYVKKVRLIKLTNIFYCSCEDQKKEKIMKARHSLAVEGVVSKLCRWRQT